MNDLILVTGGAGFIGSNLVLRWLRTRQTPVVNLDNFTYAGNIQNLAEANGSGKHILVRGDICDPETVKETIAKHQPCAILHLAAESHVDRSILGPGEFVRTNINGTFTLLQAAREYWQGLGEQDKKRFRFIHVSTDEVYGSLGPDDPAFSESTPYSPNSPYSASKASSDHLARAYYHTYGLPTIITNCSNNYGPHQFPEKLIPLMILNACNGKPLPVYGDGLNVRDWLYVEDHCEALQAVLEGGRPGETYNIGGNNELKNIYVVKALCSILDGLRPSGAPHESLITYIKDRPGHDRRYAIDSRKIASELGWKPKESFESGLRKTVEWYLAHQDWIASIHSGKYREWVELQYGRS